MEPRFHLAILTTLWKRPALGALVLGYYAGLTRMWPGTIKVSVVAVCSPGDHQDERYGILYMNAPNAPLSNKHNRGLEAVRGLPGSRVDAVCVVGSDDLVNGHYLRDAIDKIKAGADVVMPMGVHVVDLEGLNAFYIPRATPGAGRLYSRSLLDKLGWNLWVPGRNKELDSSTFIVMNPHNPAVEILNTSGSRTVVALKGMPGENLWSAESLLGSAGKYGGSIPEKTEELLRTEFPSVAEELLNLYAPKAVQKAS